MGGRFTNRIICAVTLAVFLMTSVMPSYAQSMRVLPVPGTLVNLSPSFNPSVFKGIKVYPNNPLRLDFILDKGDDHAGDPLDLSNAGNTQRLIKYFLASLTVPEKDLWVNLSPYEKDRIIPDAFGQTEMGRDLLAQDYILKQITSSLLYPEGETGKKFWARVYKETYEKFGTTDIPVDTFNKVWIMPDKAVVYENAQAATAYIVNSHLKVMLETDYLALEKNDNRQYAGRDKSRPYVQASVNGGGSLLSADGQASMNVGGNVSSPSGPASVNGGGSLLSAAGQASMNAGVNVSSADGPASVNGGGSLLSAAVQVSVNGGGSLLSADGQASMNVGGNVSSPSGPAFVNGVGSLLSADGQSSMNVGAQFIAPSDMAKQILRDIIIPILEKEVNEGQNFAQLRQVYQSLILAAWYKKKIKESLLSQVYVDKNKIQGTKYPDSLFAADSSHPAFTDPEQIWQQYVAAFKKGAFNLVKEERDAVSAELIPRKYFSGGFSAQDRVMSAAMKVTTDFSEVPESAGTNQSILRVLLQKLSGRFREEKKQAQEDGQGGHIAAGQIPRAQAMRKDASQSLAGDGTEIMRIEAQDIGERVSDWVWLARKAGRGYFLKAKDRISVQRELLNFWIAKELGANVPGIYQVNTKDVLAVPSVAAGLLNQSGSSDRLAADLRADVDQMTIKDLNQPDSSGLEELLVYLLFTGSTDFDFQGARNLSTKRIAGRDRYILYNLDLSNHDLWGKLNIHGRIDIESAFEFFWDYQIEKLDLKRLDHALHRMNTIMPEALRAAAKARGMDGIQIYAERLQARKKMCFEVIIAGLNALPPSPKAEALKKIARKYLRPQGPDADQDGRQADSSMLQVLRNNPSFHLDSDGDVSRIFSASSQSQDGIAGTERFQVLVQRDGQWSFNSGHQVEDGILIRGSTVEWTPVHWRKNAATISFYFYTAPMAGAKVEVSGVDSDPVVSLKMDRDVMAINIETSVYRGIERQFMAEQPEFWRAILNGEYGFKLLPAPAVRTVVVAPKHVFADRKVLLSQENVEYLKSLFSQMRQNTKGENIFLTTALILMEAIGSHSEKPFMKLTRLNDYAKDLRAGEDAIIRNFLKACEEDEEIIPKVYRKYSSVFRGIIKNGEFPWLALVVFSLRTGRLSDMTGYSGFSAAVDGSFLDYAPGAPSPGTSFVLQMTERVEASRFRNQFKHLSASEVDAVVKKLPETFMAFPLTKACLARIQFLSDEQSPLFHAISDVYQAGLDGKILRESDLEGIVDRWRLTKGFMGEEKIIRVIVEHISKGSDAAQDSGPGGIDLTADRAPLEVRNSGEGINLKVDAAMLEQMQNAPGFIPVIMNVLPMTDLKVFLGEKK
ncbi:MAG: hypothetical protein HQL22_01130 [Candidatus Omnitrophica bacterium]|nr:hypothetical protein [Candidatus Omnitrophota bacterium]